MNTRYSTLRGTAILGMLFIALAFAPAARAGARIGFSVNVALPPGVHVSVSNYEPYYVGRVFYQPLAVWRPVYSFPVETPQGVVYRPYVYDRGRVICQDYIPGGEAGYGEFVIDGHGHYNPRWHRDRWDNRHAVRYRGYDRHDHGWNRHDRRAWDGDGHRNWKHGRDDDEGRDGHGHAHKRGHR